MPVAETTFGVTYEGPAVATGRMPVGELAPALLALGDLFTEASAILRPDWEPVSLSIKATDDGSFLVRLVLESEDVWDQLVNVFGSAEATALVNLKEILLAAGGLMWLIKRLKDRKVETQDSTPDPGVIRLTLDDKTTIDVPAQAWALFRQVEIRRKAAAVVAPLARDGVEAVRFESHPNNEEVIVEKADLPAYQLREEPDEQLLDQEQEMYVEVASVAFVEGNKWRLSLGDQTFWATMEDGDFLERVERGVESFRKGDTLHCLVRVVQTRSRVGELQTDHHVTRVVEHLPRPTQLTLGEE